MKKIFVLFLFICLSESKILIYAQYQLTPGQWRDHLAYKRIKKIVPAENKIFCASSSGLLYYNKADNTINTISRVQGLSDCSIGDIAYDTHTKTLVVVYTDLNIDFIKNNKVTNFPVIRNKLTIANKKINSIKIHNGKAYLACGFGIVVIDLDKYLVIDTYYLGIGSQIEEVFDIAIDDNNIYAVTENRIVRADVKDPFLVDFSRWQTIRYNSSDALVKKIEVLSDILFAWVDVDKYESDSIVYFRDNQWAVTSIPPDELRSITVSKNRLVVSGHAQYTIDASMQFARIASHYNGQYATYDNDGELWVADTYRDLVRTKPSGNTEDITINSPTFAKNVKVDVKDGQIWTVAGLLSVNWFNQYNKEGFAGFYNYQWHSFYSEITPELSSYHDFVNVRINPFNPSQVYIAGWWAGLVLFENGNFTFFNAENKNSTIQEDIFWPGHCYVYGIDFDGEGNVWVTNARTLRPLSVRKKDGTWKSFALPYLSNYDYYVGDILVTSWGHKWITIPRKSTLVIFDDNGTIDNESDDRVTTLSLGNLVGSGNALINSNRVYSVKEDRSGNLWAATDAGPVEITGAQYIFDAPDYVQARKILVSSNIGDNVGAYLLETESINAITIDGGNRKWMATQNSGAYLISADGTQVIQNFNKENSPLLSNTVLDIAIDHRTGEVYFATDKGLISYRGYATWSNDDFGDVYVFPNPVRENYHGDIIVTNLLTNAIVKITDAEGNLVYETRANGGQAVWNGKNLRGQRAKTGVYFIFCSNNDGSKTKVIKLLFIH
ncbi:MAG: T9SS type A sorting domain-containing protein [Bacteroidales bacterium]|nr:T9SS type A sorting domain-containing protein [Bacteroidales bacterium]